MLWVDPAQQPTARALSLQSLQPPSPRPSSSSSETGAEAEAGGDGWAAQRWLRGALDAAGVELAGEDEVVAVRAAAAADDEERASFFFAPAAAPPAAKASACATVRIPLSLIPEEPSSQAPFCRPAASAPRPPPFPRAASCESELDAETLDALRKLWLTSSSSKAAVMPSPSWEATEELGERGRGGAGLLCLVLTAAPIFCRRVGGCCCCAGSSNSLWSSLLALATPPSWCRRCFCCCHFLLRCSQGGGAEAEGEPRRAFFVAVRA